MKIGQLLYFLTALSFAVFSGGCTKESRELKRDKPEKLLAETNGAGTRLKHVKLYKDTVYVLNGIFRRESGELLEIEPGTVIKAQRSPGTALLIQRGAFIMARGTTTEPIVFTSAAPSGTQANGSWGGITIEGRAPVNTSNPGSGIPSDSSGVLSFVRVEFGGITLRGVGDKTTLDHLQVSYSGGRYAFRFEGGTFNARYLLSFASAAEADFYFTNGCNARLQHVLAYRHPFFGRNGTDTYLTGMLIENNQFSNQNALPKTNPVISNATILGMGNLPQALKIYSDTNARTAALIATGGTLFQLRNCVFAGFPAAAWYLNDHQTAAAINFQSATATHSVFHSGTLRDFYLQPGSYLPFGSGDFKNFMLQDQFRNRVFQRIEDLGYAGAFNFSKPALQLAPGSALLTGADFSGNIFSHPFFVRVPYIGAPGTDDWLQGWVNFEPLRTEYNPLK
jgi:hypothetical protein